MRNVIASPTGEAIRDLEKSLLFVGVLSNEDPTLTLPYRGGYESPLLEGEGKGEVIRTGVRGPKF